MLSAFIVLCENGGHSQRRREKEGGKEGEKERDRRGTGKTETMRKSSFLRPS